MKRFFLLAILCSLVACSSAKPRVKACEYNDDCRQGYRCTDGICTDIHHPFLGAQPAGK